ncbi:MAG: MASE1 domain-containing protein [Nitrospirota bacterium]
MALAACLLLGPWVWPGIFLGAFLTNVTTAGSVFTSLGIATGNTLEGLIGAYLVTRFANGCRAFERTQDVFKFVGLAGLASTAVSASVGVTSLAFGGYADWDEFGIVWLTWWLGDVGGSLVVAPLLILWSQSPIVRWGREQALEAAAILVALVAVGLAVFGGWSGGSVSKDPLEFLSIPILVWVAFRFGQRETAAATVLLAGIAVWGTLQGVGPFTRPSVNESFLLLQAFLNVVAVTAMALAAGISERRLAEEGLRESRERLQLALAAGRMGIWDFDFASGEVLWPPGLEAIHGMEPGTFGGTFAAYEKDIHPEDHDRVLEAIARSIEHKQEYDVEYRITRPDGATLWVNGKGHVVCDRSGRPVRMTGVCMDVTSRRLAQEALRNAHDELEMRVTERTEELTEAIRALRSQINERDRAEQDLKASEERFRLLMEGVEDYAIFMLDPGGCVTTWNVGAERITGYRTDEVLGRHVACFYPPEGVAAGKPDLALKMAASRGRFEDEGWRVCKDGTQFWVQGVITALWDQSGELRGFVQITRDITERKRAEAVQRQLLEQVLSVREEERKRIARELHDGPGQTLTSLLVGLRAAEEMPTREAMRARVEDLRKVAALALTEIRRLAMGLRPSVLDDLGLDAALRRLAADFTQTHGLSVEVYADGLASRRLPSPVETALYRIAQEGLTNVAKHAAARTVSLLLRSSGSDVQMIIEDDGAGFQVEAALQSADGRRHLGLHGMRERTARLNGSLEIESRPGGGTSLYVKIPL